MASAQFSLLVSDIQPFITILRTAVGPWKGPQNAEARRHNKKRKEERRQGKNEPIFLPPMALYARQVTIPHPDPGHQDQQIPSAPSSALIVVCQPAARTPLPLDDKGSTLADRVSVVWRRRDVQSGISK